MKAAALLVLATLAGCIVKEAPADGVVVAGEVDGSSATQQYFKLYLKDDAGEVAIANFDRRDWYVTGVEREVSERSLLSASVRGTERGILNEIVASRVLSPGELNEYLFENMERRAVAEGREFDRVALDREWDARLAGAAQPPVAPTSLPTLPLP